MKIGVLKEKDPEKRVVLLPESIKTLVNLKTEVVVESNAGEKVFVTDKAYEEAGASVADRKTVLAQCDLILQINSLSVDELNDLDASKVVLGALNPFQNATLVEKLVAKKITSFSLELVPRISRAQSMDILSSMATVAGYKAVLDAALHLPRFFFQCSCRQLAP
jgi:NAD(P) transhydrogenase subunit alpha